MIISKELVMVCEELWGKQACENGVERRQEAGLATMTSRAWKVNSKIGIYEDL